MVGAIDPERGDLRGNCPIAIDPRRTGRGPESDLIRVSELQSDRLSPPEDSWFS